MPGASATYLGGVIAYATAVKVSVLGVPASLVEEYGVVSPQCARAMARGVRDLTGSTYALATTGVAGPTEQESRAVGTVFVGLSGPAGEGDLALDLTGDRDDIVQQTLAEALGALTRLIEQDGPDRGTP